MRSEANKEFLKDREDLRKAALEPDAKLKIAGKPSHRKRQVRRLWNEFGGLLDRLSATLEIDRAVAVAVLCVESGGRGFGSGGRMIIRFENHVFWRYWGRSHPSDFSAHFKFDPGKPWRGHRFRGGAKGRWILSHRKGQAGEWKAFELARSKHEKSALFSISMGMPQIMGFNHLRIGHKSAGKMFDYFDSGERNQVIGLFDFVKADSKMIRLLRKEDFASFAKLYNGPARAAVYASRLEGYCQEFKSLTQKKG